MNYGQALTDKIAMYATDLFNRFQRPELLYHNLHHTHNVVEHVHEIAGKYSLGVKQLFIINAAAWFHDCGHLFGIADGHEERSNLVMRNYMETIGIDNNTIQLIEQCILATHFPFKPTSLLDEIICDADTYHLGTTEFIKTNELVKKEFGLRNNFLYFNWDELTLSFLEKHVYFTDYCKSLLKEGKQKNIEMLRAKIKA